MDEAALVKLAQSRGNGDGEVKEASNLHRCAEQPVDRLTARILEHQHGSTGVTNELERTYCPRPVEFVLQLIFMCQAIVA